MSDLIFNPPSSFYRCVCGFEDYRADPSCKNCEESRFEEVPRSLEERIAHIEDYLEGLHG
jgi:hypothetical protein